MGEQGAAERDLVELIVTVLSSNQYVPRLLIHRPSCLVTTSGMVRSTRWSGGRRALFANSGLVDLGTEVSTLVRGIPSLFGFSHLIPWIPSINLFHLLYHRQSPSCPLQSLTWGKLSQPHWHRGLDQNNR